MRAVITTHTKIKDEELLSIVSSWLPAQQDGEVAVEKANEILATLPPDIRRLAEPTLKAKLLHKTTNTWGIVTAEMKNTAIFRFKHDNPGALEEASQRLIDDLQGEGTGHFEFREPILLLERDSQDPSIKGNWFTGGWLGAVRERKAEARVAVVMFLITGALVWLTWPHKLPNVSSLAGYQTEWLMQQLGRVSTATLIAFAVSTLEIVFHYFDAARYKRIRWVHVGGPT